MYYVIMYGSVLLGIIAILVCGIMMLITPADKVNLKPGQTREMAVKNQRKLGKLCITAFVVCLILIAYVVCSVGIEYIPGIGY